MQKNKSLKHYNIIYSIILSLENNLKTINYLRKIKKIKMRITKISLIN